MSKLGVGISFLLQKYYEKKSQGKEHLDVNLEQIDETTEELHHAEASRQAIILLLYLVHIK